MRLHAIKSWYEGQGLITLEDDVLSIVRQVRELYEEKVTIELDPDTGWYHFVGHENGTDYLIFSTDCLDPRALDRLRRSDCQWIGYQDPYEAAEREQDELQLAIDTRLRERVSEEGERLIHALKKDGVVPHLPTTVSIPREVN